MTTQSAVDRLDRLRLGLACVALLTGCSGPLDLPPGQRTPYLQGVLDPSLSIQSIWVEWGVPADSSFDPSVRPVDTALVHLVLVLPDGSQVPFQPAGNTPGRFDVSVSILPDSTYALQGTVNGEPVTATVRVPGVLTVLEPVSDTIRLVASPFIDSVRFRWASNHASLFVAQALLDDGSVFTQAATSDTVDFVTFFRFADTVSLRVQAYDNNAAGFIFSSPPVSSARGVVGFLGAVAAARRFTVIWE